MAEASDYRSFTLDRYHGSILTLALLLWMINLLGNIKARNKYDEYFDYLKKKKNDDDPQETMKFLIF